MSENTFMLAGPVGELETILQEPPDHNPSVVAIVCHPHPLHGGTMYNKVVTTLCRSYVELGFPCVRFNFRGVGKSEGHYAEALGEQDDLHAVIAWARERYPEAMLHLLGFSFGSYVVYSVVQRYPDYADFLVLVAPPVHHAPFDRDQPLPCDCLVIQGEQDEIVPASKVYAWAEELKPRPQILRFEDASHFFHGKLLEMRAELQTIVRGRLA